METVQFLLFPTVVQAIIIHFMDINTILMLSTLSEKIRKVIQHANVKLQLMSIQLANEKTVISMDRNGSSYHIHLFDKWKNYLTEQTVDFTDFSVNRTNCITPVEQQKQILNYLLHLFKIEKLHVCIEEKNLQSSYLWHLKQKFQLLNVKQVCPALSLEDVTFLLTNLQSKSLDIEGTVESKQQYRHGLTNESVTLRNPTWLHFDAILNSTSSHVKLHSCKERPTSQNINSLLKKWVAGGLPNLRSFQVFMTQVPYSEIGFNFGNYQSESLIGLWVKKDAKPEKLAEFEGQHLLNGKYICRPNGENATVLLEEKRILIHVWNTRNN